MKNRLKLLFGLFVFWLFFPTSVFASTFTISSTQTDITDSDQIEIPVTLSIKADDGTNYYLRGEFYQEGTHNYCGYTWNGTGWYNGPYTSNGSWKNLLKATIQDDTWSDKLFVKFDSGDSACQESGTYLFKVIRYTEDKGSPSSSDNTLTFQVHLPTPTPEETVEPTEQTTPTTQTAIVTKVPTPPKTSTSSKTTIPSKTQPTSAKMITQTVLAAKTATLSAAQASTFSGLMRYEPTTSPKKSPTLTPEVMGISQENSSYIFMAIGGAFLLAVCGILGFQKFRESNKI